MKLRTASLLAGVTLALASIATDLRSQASRQSDDAAATASELTAANDCNDNGVPDEYDLTQVSFAHGRHYGDGASFGQNITLGDIDGDEIPDAVLGGYQLLIHRGLGAGAFSPPEVDEIQFFQAALVDLDGDTDLDLVGLRANVEQVSVRRNPGDGRFAAVGEYPVGGYPTGLATTDLERDGDADLIGIVQLPAGGAALTVLRNDGSARFSTDTPIPLGSFAGLVSAADLDGDRDNDVIVTDEVANSVIVFENRGGTLVRIRDIPVTYPRAVTAADLDGDTDLDLAVVPSSGYVGPGTLLRNDGAFTFAVQGELTLPELTQDLAAADFDRDGDLDLLAAGLAGVVGVLRNDGHGTFSEPLLFAVPEPLPPYTSAKAEGVAVRDLDGDEDLDVAVAGGGVAVLLNRGNGTLNAPQLLQLSEGVPALVAADFNGDGYTDVAVAASPYLSGSVAILESAGDGTLTRTSLVELATPPRDIAAADLDGDFDIDLAVASPNEEAISILRNLGGGSFAAPVLVHVGARPATLRLADWSGDGLADLAFHPENTFAINLWRNLGDASFEPVHSFDGSYGDIALADIDGDSDVDLVSMNGDLVFWRRLDADTWSERMAVPMSRGVFGDFEVADVTGDGALDVVGINETALVVGRNQGDASFALVQTSLDSRYSRLFGVADFDRDGDPDLLARANFFPVVVRGDGTGGFALPIEAARSSAESAVIADVDHDGDPDIVTARQTHSAGPIEVKVVRNTSTIGGSSDCNHNAVPDECDPDADGDGEPDDCDACPHIFNQRDDDADGVTNCPDNCPRTANPDQADDDGDSRGNACDACPQDADKTAPGLCGCGLADVDTDRDGTPDCNDGCPFNRYKLEPGECGCPFRDIDSDGDAFLDCFDACPNDPLKTNPGRCGCGFVEVSGVCAVPTPTSTPTGPTPTPTPAPRSLVLRVRSLIDEIDAILGDGECRSIASGVCTLRAAVEEANAHPGRDRILLPSGVFELYVGGSDEDEGARGDLDIIEDLEISGTGAGESVVDGAHHFGIFEVHPNADVKMSGLTIRNGRALTGGVEGAGGIVNRGHLLLSKVRLQNNVGSTGDLGQADTGALANLAEAQLLDVVFEANAGGRAGAITNRGTLDARRTRIDGSSSASQGAVWNLAGATFIDLEMHGNLGHAPYAAGLFNALGALTIDGCRIVDGFGGGITALSGTVSVRHCEIASHSGDGIHIMREASLQLSDSTVRDSIGGLAHGVYMAGQGHIERTTISGNQATLYGGGILNEGVLEVVNTTISGNRAALTGGGVYNLADLTLNHVTIADNHLDNRLSGAGLASDSMPVRVASTILALNADLDGAPSDCAPSMITSLGHNLVGNAVGCAFPAIESDRVGVDAKLGPLQVDFGATAVHALGAGSAAIDAADAGSCPPHDQRGVPRPHGVGCDIGAYEATTLCGNGALDVSESCDDGNLEAEDCCNRFCLFEPATRESDANCDSRVTAADFTGLVSLLSEGRRAACGRDDADGDCVLSASDLTAAASGLFGSSRP